MSRLPVGGRLPPDTADPAARPAVGESLKSLRQARGLDLPEVSARIKYSVLQLDCLEAGDWSRLPAGMPLRGLVRNYARFLQADEDAMLRLLDEAVGPVSRPAAVAVPGKRSVLVQADLRPRGEPAHRTWAWMLLILVLFVVVGVYAINRGWVPYDWLVFDWLKALRS
jgi:cytoskeletal protein RodZ